MCIDKETKCSSDDTALLLVHTLFVASCITYNTGGIFVHRNPIECHFAFHSPIKSLLIKSIHLFVMFSSHRHTHILVRAQCDLCGMPSSRTVYQYRQHSPYGTLCVRLCDFIFNAHSFGRWNVPNVRTIWYPLMYVWRILFSFLYSLSSLVCQFRLYLFLFCFTLIASYQKKPWWKFEVHHSDSL